jgi:hypothetical protein
LPISSSTISAVGRPLSEDDDGGAVIALCAGDAEEVAEVEARDQPIADLYMHGWP